MPTLQEALKSLEILVRSTPEPETALQVENPKPSLSKKPQIASLPSAMQNGQQRIKDNPAHQNQLSRLLEQCYSTLRKYGEKADVTGDRDKTFQMVLGEFTIEQVNRAFALYLSRHSELPTPAEIVGYIDPWRRRLCPRMYSALVERKRKGIADGRSWPLSSDEEEYIRRYEDQQFGIY